jgi:integrative and conjugative element protein (TIGR02256 family)
VADGGVELARRQLLDLVEVAGGAVEIVEETETTIGTVFVISLDTAGLDRGPGGIEVRSRERFQIVARSGFPFEPPSVWSVHRRWAKTPHVQFGRYLCLYAAPSVEWNPSDGMRGFINRLSEWLERAAAGTLDPDGQPLHPPAVYSKSEVGTVLVHPDVGDRVPWSEDGTGVGAGTLYAWCAVSGRRIDVLEWVDTVTAFDRVVGDSPILFDEGRPTLVIPVVLICDQLGFEYPRTVKPLSEGLAESGYDKETLLSDLATATVINRALREQQKVADLGAAGEPWDPSDDDAAPLLTAMLVGTPSRRVDAEVRLAHLAAWKLDEFSADLAQLFARARRITTEDIKGEVAGIAFRWFDRASIDWMDVMEVRPEVTRRRDQGTPMSWLIGKRVLVLGCGALGAPVAEFCARAGVTELTVADEGVVNPGILVRQPYEDADIGRPKASTLADRLSRLRPGFHVIPDVGDVRTSFFLPRHDLSAYDLVIDATADAAVRAVIESARRQTTVRPPLVTMVIGHDAQRGLVTTNLSAASGAGADTFRKVALHAASGAPEWVDVADDLFPAKPRTQLFFPEPGCSSPTFIGSAAQTAGLAGTMLNEALMVLADVRASATSFASAVRLGDASDRQATTRAEWASDVVERDQVSGLEVRISTEVLAEVRAESRRGARVRGRDIETGGMLFGAFDDAIGVVHVDRVSGPPPDSLHSALHFQHGIEGVQDRVDAVRVRTRGISAFIGIWHTHPGGRAYPSSTDECGMAYVVGPDGSRQRALMAIFGGPDLRWAPWRDGQGGGAPDVYVRVVPRASGPTPTERPTYIGGFSPQMLPPGTYFTGGYGGRTQVVVAVGGNVAGAGVAVPWWRQLVVRNR